MFIIQHWGIHPYFVRRLIVPSLALSVNRYEVTIFAHCSELWHSRMNGMLNGLLKSVAFSSPFLDSNDIFSTLSFPNFFYLYKQRVILNIF